MQPLDDRRALRPILLLLILLTFAWRAYRLTAQSLWRDEVDAVYFAVRDLPQTLSMFVQAGQNGVLYFLSLRPWFSLVGTSEFALRYPSIWFATLIVPLLWQVARRLAPTMPAATDDAGTPVARSKQQRWWALTMGNAPLLAVLFYIANPYQLWYGQEGKMYTLVTVLALAATWFWLRGIGTGGWRPWLGYLITVSLAIYSHLLMIMLIPLHLLWYALAWPQSKRHWRGFSLALAGLTLPYLPMLVWQWDLLFDSQQRSGFTFVPLPEVAEKLLLDYSRGFKAPDDLLWLAPIFFLGAAGLLLGALEIRIPPADSMPALSAWRRYALIVTWLVAPILTIHLLSLRQPIFTPRYLIWIAPAMFMLMALGVQLLWRNGGKIGQGAGLLLVAYVLGFWGYVGIAQQHAPIKYDLRSGVTAIATRRPPEELLILQIPHMEYAYRYYSSDQGPRPLEGSDARLGRWAGGLWTNNGWTDEQAKADVDRQMQALTAGMTRVWVLRSEVEMWDSRHLMDQWLDEHGTMIDSATFHGAQMRLYELTP
jgi:mannosyltransferase